MHPWRPLSISHAPAPWCALSCLPCRARLHTLHVTAWGCGAGPPVLQSVNLQLERGSRMLLVGANGAGKTTLLKIIAGADLAATGQRAPERDV